MGTAAGQALLKTAHGRSFGATIKQLKKNGLLSPDLAAEFARLPDERNWLVHGRAPIAGGDSQRRRCPQATRAARCDSG
jgi:hypothetical protein